MQRLIGHLLWISCCWFGFSLLALGSPTLDRRYPFRTLIFLPSSDNIDGIFEKYLLEICEDYLKNHTVYALKEMSAVVPILKTAKIPYARVIQDLDILKQIGLTSGADHLIRTQVIHHKDSYSLQFDWFSTPTLQLLGHTQWTLQEPRNAGERVGFQGDPKTRESIHQALDQLFGQVPILGEVTGREQNTVLVNLGSPSQLKPGDILSIATLDATEVHPLFNQVIHWQWTSTGQVKVIQVEQSLSFCELLEENPHQQVLTGQKIVSLQPAKTFPVVSDLSSPISPPSLAQETPPQWGWIGASLPWIGNFSRNLSSSNGSLLNSGGYTLFGGGMEGELWLTPEWFVDLSLGYAFGNFSQKNQVTGLETPATQNGGLPASLFSMRANLGYTHSFGDSSVSPRAWVKLGYQSNSYRLPILSSEGIGPISFSSLFAGVGGQMPLSAKWGLIGDLQFRLLSFVTQTGFTGSAQSASDGIFFMGGYSWFNPHLLFRAGIQILVSGATFSSTESSLDQKMVTVAPALLYYF